MIPARLKRSPTIARKVLWSTSERSRCTTTTRSSPFGMRSLLSRKCSRSRRFMRFRATAPPTRLLTATPRRRLVPGPRRTKRLNPFQETFSPRRMTPWNSVLPRIRSAPEKDCLTCCFDRVMHRPAKLLGAFCPLRADDSGCADPLLFSSDAEIRGSAFVWRASADTSASLAPPCPGMPTQQKHLMLCSSARIVNRQSAFLSPRDKN